MPRAARTYSIVHGKYRDRLARLASNRRRQRHLWTAPINLLAKVDHHGHQRGLHWAAIPGENEATLDELGANARPVNSHTRW